jgi:hypothetical protein
LETGSWIAIYLPLLVVFIALQQQADYQRHLIVRRRKRRGMIRMTNELLQKYIGRTCKLSSGSYGTTVRGQIVEVNENWVEVETAKGRELINAEFIQTIKVLS